TPSPRPITAAACPRRISSQPPCSAGPEGRHSIAGGAATSPRGAEPPEPPLFLRAPAGRHQHIALRPNPKVQQGPPRSKQARRKAHEIQPHTHMPPLLHPLLRTLAH